MTLPQIQTKLFSQLAEIGTSIKPECSTRITKDIDTTIIFELYDFSQTKTTGKWVRVLFERINPYTIQTTADIHAVIHRIWQAIPAECKKDPQK